MIDGIIVLIHPNLMNHYQDNPKHGFAFKMKLDDQISEATVVDIDWEPTMYAYIQPTVIIKPVNLGGLQ